MCLCIVHAFSLCLPGVMCEVSVRFVCVLTIYSVGFMCAGVRLRNPNALSAHLRAHTGATIFGVMIYDNDGTQDL